MILHLARMFYPVTTLGPGQRITLWLQGCSLHCEGCANPDLWAFTPDTRIEVRHLAEAITAVTTQHPVQGLTVSGGEPFEQAEALVELLALVRDHVGDVLVYSGRTREQLEQSLPAPLWAQAQGLIDVLVDGPYRHDLNDNQVVLRGSTNQRILYLNPDKQPWYEAYLLQGRSVQNVYYGSSLLSVGIHNREE